MPQLYRDEEITVALPVTEVRGRQLCQPDPDVDSRIRRQAPRVIVRARSVRDRRLATRRTRHGRDAVASSRPRWIWAVASGVGLVVALGMIVVVGGQRTGPASLSVPITSPSTTSAPTSAPAPMPPPPPSKKPVTRTTPRPTQPPRHHDELDPFGLVHDVLKGVLRGR